MISKIVRKSIILTLLIGFIWVNLYSLIDLQTTFIFSIAEQIVNYNLFIAIALVATAIIGFTYRNCHSFYSVYINIMLIIGYPVFLSMCVTEKYTLSVAFVVIFSIGYILLFVLKEKYGYNKYIERKGELAPINRHKDLYSNRIDQMNDLINLIKDDVTNYGYSICVSGEWGIGKTSFVNSVMDKINEESKTGISEIKLEEIRINAMELDDLESLIKYFFNRVKDILQSNGLYVGINSEYQDLMGSLAGTVIDESISNFMMSRFSPNSDYRENLKNLSQLIEHELPNSKIIIIVDDLERCDNAKVMDFLFFIKEIAMLNRCITIFVTDYKKMLESCELKEEFMEKFFYHKITLQSVNVMDIIKHSIADEEFSKLLNESKYQFIKHISDIDKNQYRNIVDFEERKQHKEEVINKATSHQRTFNDTISNPRRLIKIYRQYSTLVEKAESFNATDEYDVFLNKVNYKKQIFLLSLIYGLYPEEYEDLQHSKSTIYRYSIHAENEIEELIDIITHNEWNALSNNYIIDEKVRFCSYLLSSPNELPNIANGFSSLQEKYKTLIGRNQKPDGADFASVLKELMCATFNSDEEKEAIIYKAIILYSNDMSFDDLLSVVTSNSLKYNIIQDDIVLKAFCEISDNLLVIDKKRCKEEFISFVPRYLIYKLSNINRLFLSAYPECGIIDNINEVVYNKQTCDHMIDAYCDKIIKVFNIDPVSNDTGYNRLKALFEHVIYYLETNNVMNFNDVCNYVTSAHKTIDSIGFLYEIENYINSYVNDCADKLKFSNDNMLENLSKLPDYIAQHNKDEAYYLNDKITSLFYQLLDSNLMLSTDDLSKVNAIILAYYEKVGDSPASWRRMYIQMKNKSQ